MYQSIPGVGLLSKYFSPGWGLRRFPSWRLADYNMADFDGKDTEFVCKWLDTHYLGWSFSTIVFDH
jgi:hypothetical protein